MEAIQQKTLNQAIKMLNAIGCQYKIQDPDGNTYGELEVTTSYKASLEHEYGSIAAFVKEQLGEMEPGNIRGVDYSTFGKKRIVTAVCSHMTRIYGLGSFKTHHNRDKGCIDVLLFS